MTDQELDALLDGLTPVIREEFKKLETRLDALEARPAALKYCGVWSAKTAYLQDEAVTHDGGLWIAKAPSIGARPPDATAWTLAVKAHQR